MTASTQNATGGRPPISAQAPDFTLLDGHGRSVRLSDYRGKNVILAFYPADWSPVCTSEMALFQETLDDIQAHNAEVLGISVDSAFSHRAWAEAQHLTIPLLADFWPHGLVSQQYGVFREADGVSQRSLFFIDEWGVIRASWVAPEQATAPGLNIVFDTLERIEGSSAQPEVH